MRALLGLLAFTSLLGSVAAQRSDDLRVRIRGHFDLLPFPHQRQLVAPSAPHEVANQIDQDLVGTVVDQQQMPLVVEIDDRVWIAGRLNPRIQSFEPLQLLIRRHARDAKRFGVEQVSDRINLVEFVDGQRHHEGADARDRDQSVFTNQASDSFPKGGSADAEIARQVNFVDARAGGNCAVNDHLTDTVGQLLADVRPLKRG